MYKKNILIVTASIGSGHNKAAEAVCNEIKRKYPDASVNVVDFMSKEAGYINCLLKEIYLKMLDFVPPVYDFLYNFTGGRLQGLSAQSMLALAMKKKMAELIAQYRADLVICTHPFPCAAASYLRRIGELDAFLACIVTDFSIHQMWVYKNVDLYFVATEEAREDLSGRSIPKERIHAAGIPVDFVFRQNYEKKALLEKFQLDEKLPAALIMGGGLGLGGVKSALRQLDGLDLPMQILVVTGANSALWTEIQENRSNSRHKIAVWGYSNNVQELMAVATFLISKPGALTICEALAMELPMLLHEPIPGPEMDNAAYVASKGAAIWVRDNKKIGEVAEKLLTDPQKLRAMRDCAHRFKHPEAALSIVEILSEQYGEKKTPDQIA